MTDTTPTVLEHIAMVLPADIPGDGRVEIARTILARLHEIGMDPQEAAEANAAMRARFESRNGYVAALEGRSSQLVEAVAALRVGIEQTAVALDAHRKVSAAIDHRIMHEGQIDFAHLRAALEEVHAADPNFAETTA